jgi:RNA polymerase sigma-70 factor (ECF subfamily)
VVRRVLAGDREAFRVLVETEGQAVVRTCERILGNRHDAEDAAQETFVIAYRSLGTWRADGPFGAWLARIAVRIALRHVAQRRNVAWLDPMASSTAVDESVRAAEVAEVGSDPLGLALLSERAASVRRAVATLAEPYREIVALRFFAERSLVEIAHETGRPLGTVKTQLHRGLVRLRAELESGSGDSRELGS